MAAAEAEVERLKKERLRVSLSLAQSRQNSKRLMDANDNLTLSNTENKRSIFKARKIGKELRELQCRSAFDLNKQLDALHGLKAVTIEQMDFKDHTDSTHKDSSADRDVGVDDGKRAISPRAQDKPGSSSKPEPN